MEQTEGRLPDWQLVHAAARDMAKDILAALWHTDCKCGVAEGAQTLMAIAQIDEITLVGWVLDDLLEANG